MLFNISKLSALLLAAYATASPLSVLSTRNPEWQEMTVIGYRTCDKIEADNYNDENKPIKPDALYNKKDQTGDGIYTSPSPGEWPSNLYASPRFCIITAHPQAFDGIPKVWIPESQWDKPEEFVAEWVRQQGLDPRATLRLSRIGTQPDKVQMMIPRWLTAWDHDTIGMYAECFDSIDKLPTRDRINYGEWKNIKGESQLDSDAESDAESAQEDAESDKDDD